jgi:hypothetical protein
MSERVAIFSFNEWEHPLQVQFDIALKLQADVENIFFIAPNNLPCRDPGSIINPKLLTMFGNKTNREQLQIKLAYFDNVIFVEDNFLIRELSFEHPIFDIPYICSLDFIKGLQVDGFQFGEGILNSLGDFYNFFLYENVVFHHRIIKELISSYLSVYFSTLNFLSSKKIDSVYIFNGRLIHELAVINACKKSKIDFKTYELSELQDSYNLCQGQLLSIKNFTYECRNYYEKHFSISNSFEIENWFSKRAEKEASNLSFINERVKPKFIDKNLYDFIREDLVLTFFSGTSNELIHQEKDLNQIFNTQEDAFLALYSQVMEKQNNIKILVRTHPRMRLRPRYERAAWKKFLAEFKGVYNIPPNSPVDSYQLLKLSDYVAVFHSTVGVEAKFFGKRTIILGAPNYSQLPGLENVKSIDEISNFLDSSDIEFDRTGINMYAFYFSNSGKEIKNRINFKIPSSIVQFFLRMESYLYLKQFLIPHYLVNRLKKTYNKSLK